MAALLHHFVVSVAELLLAPVKFAADVAAFLFVKPKITHKAGLVLVTGSARGIGRGIVASLSRAGYTVIAGVRKDADGEQIKQAFPGMVQHHVILDVGNPESVTASASAVEQISGATGLPLVGVVNNAGIMPLQPVELLSEDHMEKILNVNFKGPLRVIQAFLPMLRTSKGRIINISSIGAIAPLPSLTVYQGTKAALDQAGNGLRNELDNQDVTVVSVRPGLVDTDLLESATVKETPGKSVSEEQVALYEPMMENVRGLAPPYKASPLDLADNTVRHAMTSPRPFAVYYYGYDSIFSNVLLSVLPETIVSKITMKMFR